mgnify:CR=1 FL=1
MINKKIIISVLAGGGDHYEQMEAAARDTCFKNPPENISIYYVHSYREGVDLNEGESKLIDDCFYYGEPASRATLLRKCIEFWGYCLENFEFDYIFRPNLGCWVSMDALNKLVNTLPMEGVYGGAFGTTKGRRGGIEFVSGSGFLLSRDVVQLIWDHHLNDKDITIEYNGNSLVDDVAIGAFLSAFRCNPDKGINIKRTLLPRIDLHEGGIDSSRIDPDCHHYYFLHPKSPNCYYLMQDALEGRKKMEEIDIRNIKVEEFIYRNGFGDNTLLKVNDIKSTQTPGIIPLFKEVIAKFDNVIEIGSEHGGLTLLLASMKKEIAKLISYEIDQNQIRIYGSGIDIRIGDCFEMEKEIGSEIQKRGRTILLCDGGSKNREVEVFSKYLKTNDVIACHDFDGGNFNEISKRVNWKFGPESHLSVLEEHIQENNLEGYRYEEFEKVLWGCWRRV